MTNAAAPDAGPTERPAADANAGARAQAQAWLDSAAVPPGAARTEESPTGFGSFTGWPCGPYEQLSAYWVVSDLSVVETANWLIEHPPADLTSTTGGPISEDWGPVDSTTVGYTPTPESQEGIVYTVQKMADGVAVRAEIAAQTDDAACPDLPEGTQYGAPGQG